MSKWVIDKLIDGISYGHRVWTQNLNEEFSGDTSCKCKFLHGHNMNVHVFLSSTTLERGFVSDFKHINWVKKFLDTHIDHKFILDTNDPLFTTIINGQLTDSFLDISDNRKLPLISVKVPETETIVGYCLDTSILSGPEQEFYEGFFLVNFVPTSENLSYWMFNFIQEKMDRIGVTVEKVDIFETPKSRASYSG